MTWGGDEGLGEDEEIGLGLGSVGFWDLEIVGLWLVGGQGHCQGFWDIEEGLGSLTEGCCG